MNASESPRRLWWLMVIAAGCYFTFFAFYPRLLWAVGVNHYGPWFLDSYALLASNDAVSLGRDAYIYNPLDPFGRPHVYSHWWLHLRDFGLTRADNFAFGGAFVFAFFIAAISRLRPNTSSEVLWCLVFLCSSAVVLAIDRANNDLVVFVLLAPIVPCLLAENRALRALAVPLIALAAALKFYPAIAGLLLLAGAETREVRARVLLGAIALALVGIDVTSDIAHFRGNAPKAEGLMTFGAANLLSTLGMTGWFAPALAIVVAVGAGWVLSQTKMFSEWTIDPPDRNAWLSFVLGAALLTGCFFTGRNYAYRWIFSIWLAPLLWRLPQDPKALPALRRFARVTAVLLVIGLWLDPLTSCVLTLFWGRVAGATLLRWADNVVLVEQPFTWALFLCLMGFLARFARDGVRTLLARRN